MSEQNLSRGSRRWLDPNRHPWEVDLYFRKEGADQPRLCFRYENERGMTSSVPYALYPRDVAELSDDEVLEHWLMLSVENPALLDAIQGRGTGNRWTSDSALAGSGKPKDPAVEAVRTDVREGLYELAKLLDEEAVPKFASITNALVHLWYHVGLSEDDRCTELISHKLSVLSDDLSSRGSIDRASHVAKLRLLADSAWTRCCL